MNDGPYNGFIEINDVPELQYTSLDEASLVLGGSVTLTTAIDMFDRAAKSGNYVYAKEFYLHFRKVAALPVRNVSVPMYALLKKISSTNVVIIHREEHLLEI